MLRMRLKGDHWPNVEQSIKNHSDWNWKKWFNKYRWNNCGEGEREGEREREYLPLLDLVVVYSVHMSEASWFMSALIDIASFHFSEYLKKYIKLEKQKI